MPFPGDSITQHHIDLANLKARQLAVICSPAIELEELESQALVVLWDLARSWDEDAEVPFGAYVGQYMKPRLIDWLRSEYGRAAEPGRTSGRRLEFSKSIRSLDQITHNERGAQNNHPALVDGTPGPDQVAEDRDELRRLSEVLCELSPFQRDLMLAPLYVGLQKETAAQWGKRGVQFGSRRTQLKRIVAARIQSEHRAVPRTYRKTSTSREDLA